MMENKYCQGMHANEGLVVNHLMWRRRSRGLRIRAPSSTFSPRACSREPARGPEGSIACRDGGRPDDVLRGMDGHLWQFTSTFPPQGDVASAG